MCVSVCEIETDRDRETDGEGYSGKEVRLISDFSQADRLLENNRQILITEFRNCIF